MNITFAVVFAWVRVPEPISKRSGSIFFSKLDYNN